MWDAQVPALVRDYRVLRYDTRGHGATEGTPPPYSIDLLVDDARALLDALNIASVHFVGLSLGGMIGQLFAVRYPAFLKSLVLCDTSSHMPPETLWEDRIQTAEDGGIAAMAPATIERWFTAPFRERSAAEIERIGGMIRKTELAGYVGCCRAIQAMNQTALLPQITAPTLIVVGADDPSTTVAASEIIQRAVAGSELVVLDNAAHLSNIEQPEAFNRAMTGFIEKN
ncbi:MAG: alpha/beta fold hydrolase [Rhodospirillales bacterium]|jgi:3-oxoadipate enol-lactonase|nr:alpha/beta fold hydrolase [Rhodospirillales bacterium]